MPDFNTVTLEKTVRQFLPKAFFITDWDSLKPFFDQLLARPIHSLDDLLGWMKDCSELEAAVSEDACWRQIKMTCDTTDKDLEAAFNYFCLEIQPKMQPLADALNRKLAASPYTNELDHGLYHTFLRNVKKGIELYREENVPIQAEISVLQQQYGAVAGAMSIILNDQEYTLQQASKFLEDSDRDLREIVYRKIQDRRAIDKDVLNDLYSVLIEKRHQVALHAGFDNYRDYRFKELGRFDYTEEDCFQFHQSVKEHVLPIANTIYEDKKQYLALSDFRPWDTEAEKKEVTPLRPFTDGAELLTKSIKCFEKLNPFFADCLRQMEKMGHLDLDSRKGKAPGGYNCPLAESGAPFIFMNAAGQMHDVTTMVHEGGHAIQSFLCHTLELTAFKDYPMEIAEVASMAMELFSMEYWESFFDNKDELVRAKIHQLERVITIFPWIATIDKFQHWVYEHPHHTPDEREVNWLKILTEFSTDSIDYSGLEKYRSISWQRQLHLYEVPFYYIEYGIAQLGAIGLWKQFKEDKEAALNNYINALKLGGTKTLPELYAAAGLKFDFSPAHIKTLMDFVWGEIKALKSV